MGRLPRRLACRGPHEPLAKARARARPAGPDTPRAGHGPDAAPAPGPMAPQARSASGRPAAARGGSGRLHRSGPSSASPRRSCHCQDAAAAGRPSMRRSRALVRSRAAPAVPRSPARSPSLAITGSKCQCRAGQMPRLSPVGNARLLRAPGPPRRRRSADGRGRRGGRRRGARPAPRSARHRVDRDRALTSVEEVRVLGREVGFRGLGDQVHAHAGAVDHVDH